MFLFLANLFQFLSTRLSRHDEIIKSITSHHPFRIDDNDEDPLPLFGRLGGGPVRGGCGGSVRVPWVVPGASWPAYFGGFPFVVQDIGCQPCGDRTDCTGKHRAGCYAAPLPQYNWLIRSAIAGCCSWQASVFLLFTFYPARACCRSPHLYTLYPVVGRSPGPPIFCSEVIGASGGVGKAPIAIVGLQPSVQGLSGELYLSCMLVFFFGGVFVDFVL